MSEPILFVPGLLCTEILYAPQIVAFADRPIMVADHRQHDSIPDIAAHVLSQAPDTFALVGLSMGGYIAMEILREAPERVSRVALLDTNARADTQDQTERRRFLIDLARKKDFKKVPHILYPGFVHESREDDEVLKAVVVEMAMETGAEAFIRQQTALINRIDARPRLHEISCPALVVVGDGDRLTPPDLAREIHAAIPESQFAVIEGSGHLSTLEEPKKVTAALKSWLSD
ncbi:MAG: alpha/beta fold hydrolase [Roseibium sp.]|nr:alpha/beta fold hydrolase [Roseibium sp.]